MKPGKIPGRIVIYSGDIENFFGISRRSAQRLLQKVREAKGKPRGGLVTIPEFCEIHHLDVDLVKACIWGTL